MKLLFVPAFVFSLIEAAALSDGFPNYWGAKLAGIWIGLALIPWLYYSCTYGLGIAAPWLGPGIFYLSTAAAFGLEYGLMGNAGSCGRGKAALLLLCVTAVLFIILTCCPARLPLFRDPLTGAYGISSG